MQLHSSLLFIYFSSDAFKPAGGQRPSVGFVGVSDLLVKLELLDDARPHVLLLGQLLQKGDQLGQLRVLLVVEPTLDRHAVAQLKGKRLWAVVDDDGVLQVAADHREVFQVVPFDEHAAVAEEPVPDEPPLRVQNVQQLLRIHLLRRREDHHLKQFLHLLQKVDGSRAHVDVDVVPVLPQVHGEGEVVTKLLPLRGVLRQLVLQT
mmetsp:Transcript_29128/g.61565  ORF Transcript_29128/g.61565 Transcript_29128/m.61565 type:complete len:205 (-) Transcript_29128:1306-1920(-)